MPLDRVEVLFSAPPVGKVDIYERWVSAPADAGSAAGSLAVISIGTAADAHDRTPDEIAGALAGQIERLIIERYQREHPKDANVTMSASAESLTSVAGTPRRISVEPQAEATPYPDNLTDIRSVREHMEELRKGLPLVPAGPSQNGLHPEPSPAS